MDYPWQFNREGRAWHGDETLERNNLLPESARIEIQQGKLLFSDEERMILLAMLIENIGMKKLIEFLMPYEDEIIESWLDASFKKYIETHPELSELLEFSNKHD